MLAEQCKPNNGSLSALLIPRKLLCEFLRDAAECGVSCFGLVKSAAE